MNGAITYLRTAAEIKSFVALGIKKVLDLLRLKKIRVRLQPLLRYLLKENRDNAEHLEQVALRLLAWQEARRQEGLGPAAMVYHHSGARQLHGFFYRAVVYARKSSGREYESERRGFDRVRAAWLKQTAITHGSELLRAGISVDDLERMRVYGSVPEGYQVHHRVPLDDGGTNARENLILIRDDVEHRAVHGYYNPGELRAKLLERGEQAEVVLPMPPEDTVIYPNPERGYFCEQVPNAAMVEMFDVD